MKGILGKVTNCFIHVVLISTRNADTWLTCNNNKTIFKTKKAHKFYWQSSSAELY